MNDWGVGYAIGLFTGLAIGLIAGRRQKRWSELNRKEKRIRVGLIAAGVALLLAGIIMLLIW
jgi:fructose-specific phosphotransferase system IIC component